MTNQREPFPRPTNGQKTVLSRLIRRSLPPTPSLAIFSRRSSVAIVAALSVSAMLTMTRPVAASDSSEDAEPAVQQANRETMRLTFRDGPETEVDVNKDGIGAGDYAVKTGPVYQGAMKLGRLTQSCTVLTVTPVPSLRCSLDLVLSHGQITLQGSFTLSDHAPQLAVTGGTGKYEGVHGQLTETASQGNSDRVTLHLLYPPQM